MPRGGKRASKTGSTVTVIGGGITGLTAAHELAERDFTVCVVEKASAPGPLPGRRSVQLGGMASSQYATGTTVHKFSPDAPDPPRSMTLPGEHGFHFFPAAYSNLRHTLRRIPLRNANGHRRKNHQRTVFDNITPGLDETVIGSGIPPFHLPQHLTASLTEIATEQRDVVGTKSSPTDLLMYLARMLRYMSTSSERRAAECEDISFIKYVQGWNAPGYRVPVRYSWHFLEALRTMPNALAAFDAEYDDARTNMNAAVHRLVNVLKLKPQIDGILNGPTTEAWFVHWRSHLETLGVRFYNASLERLRLQSGTPVADFAKDGRPWKGPVANRLSGSDYLVLATDVVTAERVTQSMPATGMPGALRGYTTTLASNPFEGRDEAVHRDPLTQPGLRPWDRLQTCTGIQFFFRERFDAVRGHIYVSGSPWKLTAMTEHNCWTNPPTLERDGYQAMLSVGIFAWTSPGLNGHPPAAMSTREQIAHEVWKQIKAAWPIETRSECPEPTWYTFDHGIVFAPGNGTPITYMIPYLATRECDWKRRPGAEPWQPGQSESAKRFELTEGLWQAGHGGYLIHWDKLVFAGTYTRTFTRMTTMEAACESGRHAVNAILDHRLSLGGTETYREKTRNVRPDATFSTQLGPPVAQSERSGDHCPIWDMEQEELRDFMLAKRLDRMLFEHGQPHIWQTCGLDMLVSWMSHTVEDEVAQSILERLEELIQSRPGDSEASPHVPPAADGVDLTSALRRLQRFRDELEKLVTSR